MTKSNGPREWKIYGVIAAEKGSAAYDSFSKPFTEVVDMSALAAKDQEIAELKEKLAKYDELNFTNIAALIDGLKLQRAVAEKRLEIAVTALAKIKGE